ncbi:uncharacterized protein LOC129218173 [Uloborus diversus]|uniref:uncharacterized protein LOC129218173 n=1 Tax=Uloborus diversus TaxID=327109 RepID=UPI002409A780|nr:uncharacterized protein LOC129218173 [Uloborus diversus]
MGNSHSQSLTRFAPSVLHPNNNNNNNNHKEGKNRKSPSAKFASPENRVLPIVSNVPQRLRSTDNGNILQNGGTISGRKSGSIPVCKSEPEFVQLLQKKCSAVPSAPQNTSFQTLYGHRKSHSDPDIVRMMMCENENESDEDDDTDGRCEIEGSSNQRSIIAVSPSKAKIKSRKKKRAPEPPQSNTLPRTLARVPVYYKNEHHRNNLHAPFHDSTDVAPRRPLPPIPPEEMPPPPPPPPPDYNRSPENLGVSKSMSKNYEKNRRTVEKWKFSKPNQDVNIEKNQRQRSKSLDRTEEQWRRENEEYRRVERVEKFERNNSLCNAYSQNLPQSSPACKKEPPRDAVLKEAIVDAAKRRAERVGRSREHRNPSFKTSIENSQNSNGIRYPIEQGRHESHIANNSSQYIHKNTYQLKQNDALIQPNIKYSRNETRNEGNDTENNSSYKFTRNYPIHKKLSDNRNDFKGETSKRNEENIHRENKINSRGHLDILPSVPVIRQSKWDSIVPEPIPRMRPDGTPSSSSTSEEEMEIDLQLRPTLPRRPIELPRFSPTDVWKSINLDFFKSHQQRSDVSSDDGDDIMEEKIHRINRPVAPRRLIHDRSGDSGISPDAGSPMLLNENFDVLTSNHNISCNTTNSPVLREESTAAWVPQHDLVDDSECGSDDSPVENKQSENNTQAKLSMPNLMFPSRSLPRTDQRAGADDPIISDKDRTRSRGRRKKSYKSAEGQHFNSLRNLKKALGLRTKQPPVVDDTKGLDPNWSLSRSLPNFNNIADENAVTTLNSTAEVSLLDQVRRSNSESRAMNQDHLGNKLIGSRSSQNVNSEWRKSFPGQSSDGHVIYLPEYSSRALPCQHAFPDDLHVTTDSELMMRKPGSRKKFSYQSTVRQEEKKKLEEKLAREVEERERKRQEEIEWMNKVEDEFRKQRDKEKVNIRHQLRILNLQEKSVNNEPYQKDIFKSNEYMDSNTKIQNHDQRSYAISSDEKTSPLLRNGHDNSDVAYNWKPPTGMKKWLRRQNRDYQCLSPIRPEPEGGRSSSDDCKQMDGRKDSSERKQMRNSSYQKIERPKCSHGNVAPCNICNNFINKSSIPRNDNPKISLSLDPRPSTLASSPEAEKVDKKRSMKEQQRPKPPSPAENGINGRNGNHSPESNDGHFISESVEEYELHTRLCRTNSGRTFESHSYYALERRKDDAPDYECLRKPPAENNKQTNYFSTRNFENELTENVRKKAREFEKRTRKYQPCDYDSDESINDGRDIRPQRYNARNQKKKASVESREPSFSRNHPHRNGARLKPQVNGYVANGRTAAYPKNSNNRIILPHQRITNGVIA